MVCQHLMHFYFVQIELELCKYLSSFVFPFSIMVLFSIISCRSVAIYFVMSGSRDFFFFLVSLVILNPTERHLYTFYNALHQRKGCA